MGIHDVVRWRRNQAGQTVGTTDELGLRAIDRHAHVHDIHATMLHLMGLNHINLTYLHNGRAERPPSCPVTSSRNFCA